MEYNRIVDKIKKLKELVDRGVDGEVFAAKRAIEQLCEKIEFELTHIEYIDLIGMFEFYRKAWDKTIKSSLKDLFDAFISKNHISYDNDQEDGNSEPLTFEEWKRLIRIQDLMSTMEVSLYRKQLE